MQVRKSSMDSASLAVDIHVANCGPDEFTALQSSAIAGIFFCELLATGGSEQCSTL